MDILQSEFKKYKWFFTKSGKLVVGGKSAEQNDQLLKAVKLSKKEYFIMHTSQPGSPFCVILADCKKVIKSDLEETAIFTACFSRAWKSGKKSCKVDIFLASNIYKSKSMSQGTWGVKEKLDSNEAELKLVLTKQSDVLRAVPLQTLISTKSSVIIRPGKIDKIKLVPKLIVQLDESCSTEELLAALPAGGSDIIK